MALFLVTAAAPGAQVPHTATGAANTSTPAVAEAARPLTPAVAEALRARHKGGLPVELEPFAAPRLEAAAEGVRISSGGNPAGLYLRYRLDPALTYRVGLSGRRLGGQSTLRLRRNTSEPLYHETPGTQRTYYVRHAESLELLVYADGPFEYELRGVSIETCADCPGEAGLEVAPPAGLRRLHRLVGGILSGDPRPEIAPYEAPGLETAEGGVRLTGRGGPAGVFLRYRLTPGRRYRLSVAGAPLAGETTLRLKRAGPELEYLPAPSGEQVFLVADVEVLELLFYADTDFDYLLRGVAIEECPTCSTNADLERAILASIPGLATALEEDRLEAAALLLQWAADHVDFLLSTDPEARLLVESSTSRIAVLTLAEAADMFEADRGAVFCGGAAVFYNKLLHLFGFDSFEVNFGELDCELTHVTVVVALAHDDGWRHYFFDPTFNARLLHRDTRRDAALEEVLAALARDDTSQLVFAGEPPSRREYFFYDSAADAADASEYARQGARCTTLEQLAGPAQVCVGVSYGFVQYLSKFSSLYRACGLTPDLTGFLRLMEKRFFSVETAPNAEASDAFRDLLRLHGVPIGYP